jgi:hypothetical protein
MDGYASCFDEADNIPICSTTENKHFGIVLPYQSTFGVYVWGKIGYIMWDNRNELSLITPTQVTDIHTLLTSYQVTIAYVLSHWHIKDDQSNNITKDVFDHLKTGTGITYKYITNHTHNNNKLDDDGFLLGGSGFNQGQGSCQKANQDCSAIYLSDTQVPQFYNDSTKAWADLP